MKLTTEQRAELKALAEAATPGPWAAAGHHVMAPEDCEFHPVLVGVQEGGCRLEYEVEDNARYAAAANPTTILALLADLEEAKEIIGLLNTAKEFAKEAAEQAIAELAGARKQLEAAQAEQAGIVPRDCMAEENQLLRKQLAEAQAKNRELVEYFCEVDRHVGSHIPESAYMALVNAKRVSCTAALQSAIAEAVATAVEPYKRDAERYQRLRSSTCTRPIGGIKTFTFSPWFVAKGELEHGDALDATIDAALAAKEPEKQETTWPPEDLDTQ